MKDKIIICYYEKAEQNKPGYTIIENLDDIKVSGIAAGSSKLYKNKKQAIENADRIFIITKYNSVSNYDIQLLRRDRKDGIDVFDRTSDTWGDKDKSGYDVDKVHKALKQRLYATQKDNRTEKVLSKFKEISSDVTVFLQELSDGKIPEYGDALKMEKTLQKIINVVKRIGLYKNNIPDYVMSDLEKALDIK